MAKKKTVKKTVKTAETDSKRIQRTDNKGNLLLGTMRVSGAGFPYVQVTVIPETGRPRSHLFNGESESIREIFSDMIGEMSSTPRTTKETA